MKHEALNTEKDRARASADVQSSQKTVAQRLPHEEKIPQGNALRSIPFLYLYLLEQNCVVSWSCCVIFEFEFFFPATSSVCVSDANGGGGTVVTIQPAPTAKRRLEYRTEYKKSFRPFSNYEYVGGRFVPGLDTY